MKKYIFLISLIFIAGCTNSSSVQKTKGTIITSNSEKRLIEGSHPFGYEAISKGNTRLGRVNIRKKNSQYYLQGFNKNTWISPTGVEEGGYAKLHGIVTRIADKAFIYEGQITTYGPYKTGTPCNRKARITFLRHDHEDYWHGQNVKNPCTGLFDNLNIYVGNTANTVNDLSHISPAAGNTSPKPISTMTPFPY